MLETRFVAITGIPPGLSWIDFMRALRFALLPFRCLGIRRIVRTFEAGMQIFWVGCNSHSTVLVIRGVLHGRGFNGTPPFICEDVHPDVWCARNSWTKTAWTRRKGLMLGPHDRIHAGTVPCDVCNADILSGDFFDKVDKDDERLVLAALAAQPRGWESACDIEDLMRSFESTVPPEGLILPTRLRTTRRRGGKNSNGVSAPMRRGGRPGSSQKTATLMPE